MRTERALPKKTLQNLEISSKKPAPFSEEKAAGYPLFGTPGIFSASKFKNFAQKWAKFWTKISKMKFQVKKRP